MNGNYRFYRRLAVSLFAVLILQTMTSGVAHGAPAVRSKAKSSITKARPKKKKIDYNALGLISMRKRNFGEALRHFDLATASEPKNPHSWLNRARAVVALNIATEPVDYCEYSKNWIFDAISSLSAGLDISRTKTIDQLRTFTDASFIKFRDRPEYKRWSLLTKLPLKTDIATQEFFVKYNDWLIRKQPMPATVVTFSPNHDLTITSAEGAREVGTWSAGADRVVIKMNTVPRTIDLGAADYFYEGKKGFKHVVLKDPETGEEWVMGPEIADCPN